MPALIPPDTCHPHLRPAVERYGYRRGQYLSYAAKRGKLTRLKGEAAYLAELDRLWRLWLDAAAELFAAHRRGAGG